MTDVEQKVVQMRFDDKEFDEKAKKTMKTLDKLNEKLSFDAVAKKSDAALNDMVENVEKIADKAYTIVDRVIDKIKDNIANNIFSFINDTLVGQVKTGWQKYADMTKAVGTLAARGYGMERISNILERLAFFSDETSYNFNTMLENIGRFVSSGVELEDAEQALEGIAGLAGVTGVNAETASRAMYQMSQAMGSFMKAQDWMSISTANLDTLEFKQNLIDTAVALGTLKEAGKNTYVSLRAANKKGAQAFSAEQGFVESLTSGAWVTRDVMVETYKKYASAVDKIYQMVESSDGALLAADAIKELKNENKRLVEQYKVMFGVTEDIAEQELNKINSVRKATDEEIVQYMKLKKVSRQVAETTLNAKYDEMLKDWQKRTKKTLAETEDMLTNFNGWTDSLGLKAFANSQEARTFEDVINSVKEAVSSNWRSIYTSIFGDYQEAKSLWSDMADGLVDLFAGRMYKIAAMFEEWKEAGGRNTLWQGLYAFGSGMYSLIDNIRGAWDELVSGGMSGAEKLVHLSDQIKEAGFKFYIFMRELAKTSFFNDIAQAFLNIKNFISDIFGALHAGVRDAVPTGKFLMGLLTEFSSIFKELTSNFKLSDEALDGLRRTFKGLTIILLRGKKTIVEVVIKVILPLLNAAFKILGQIVEVVVQITGTIGDILEYFIPLNKETNGLVTILEILTEVVVAGLEIAGKVVTYVLKNVVPLIGVLIGLVSGLTANIASLFNGAKIKMGNNSKTIQNFGALRKAIEDAWAPLKSFSEIIDEYRDGKGLINFLNLFTDITDGIGNRLLLTIDATAGFLEIMSESKFGKVLSYALKGIRILIHAGLWLFNNLFLPIIREIVSELGMTVDSLKEVIQKDGILGLLKVIQEVFRTGIFAEIVSTIQLFNNLIGGNGIGKLFKNAAKALESITDYFNAAKLSAAADIIFKIIGAATLLYALLALITFLPEERLEKMKDAMLDFGIALGIIVAGVLLISASAALAGGNLMALAASFATLALTIFTAQYVLERMVDFVTNVEKKTIDNALDTMGLILHKFGAFLVTVISPVALLSAKYESDVSGIGIAMAGLAASVLLLMKAASQIGEINAGNFDKLFEFLSGIYTVLSLSTALLIFAASGKDVHGISIAIASVGVAFAAIKLILPLCKDIIAEQTVFEDGWKALAVFGGFMVAFSASMFFVLRSVDSIIGSIAALLLLKAWISMFTTYIVPIVKNLISETIALAQMFQGLSNDNGFVGASIGAIIAIFGGIFFVIKMFRYIMDTFSDFDPVSAVAVAVTVLGTLITISELLLPALAEFNEKVVRKNNAQQMLSLYGVLGSVIGLVLMVMAAFVLMVWRYVDMYDDYFKGFGNVQINAGLIAKEYNGIAQVMSAVSTTIIGIFIAIAAILAVASRLNVDKYQYQLVYTVLDELMKIVGIIVIGVTALFITVTALMKTMNFLSSGNTFTILGGIGVSSMNPLVSVLKYASNTITVLAFVLPLFMSIIMGMVALIAHVDQSGKTLEKVKEIISAFSDQIKMIILELSLLAALFIIPMTFQGNSASVSSVGSLLQSASSGLLSGYKSVADAVGKITMWLAVMFSVFGALSIVISGFDADQYKRWEESIKMLTLILTITLGGLIIFSAAIGYFTNKFSKETATISNGSATAVKGWFTPFSTMLVAMLGLLGTLAILGALILPALKEFKDMELDKMVILFTKTISILWTAIIAMIAALALDKVTTSTSTTRDKSLISILKTLLLITVPLISLAVSFNFLSSAMQEMAEIDPKVWPMVGAVLGGMLAFIVGLVAGLAVLSKYTPAVILGKIAAIMLIVGGVILAVGVAAYLIGEAAMAISKAYIAWMEYQLGVQKLSAQIASMKSNPISQMTEGMKADGQEAVDTAGKILTDVENIAYKTVHSSSPSKDFRKLGKYIDQGLVLGLKDGSKEVGRTTTNLAENYVEGPFSDTLEIESPSKVFYKNGRFIVAGLDNGLQSGKSSLTSTMGEIGESLSASLQAGFDNLNFDILGGKTLDELADEFMGGLDGETIIGKLFGLDELSESDKKLVEKYQNELDKINEEAQKAGGIGPGAAQRASYLQGQIDQIMNKSTGTKLAEKAKTAVSGLLEDFSLKDTLIDVGNKLGLNLTDGATGESVISELSNKIIGKDGLVDKVTGFITDFDWTSVGTTVGGQLLSGIGTALSPITNIIKRLIHKASEDYTSVDIFNEGTLKNNTHYGNDYKTLTFRESSYSILDDKQYLKKSEEELGELYALGGTEIILDPNKVNTSKLLDAMDEDFEKRFPQFMEAIAGDRVFNEYTGKMEYFLTSESYKAIQALFDAWGIASPSKVMRYIYGMNAEGAIVGFEEKAPGITKAIEDANSEQYRAVSLGLQAIDELAEGNSLVQPSIVPIVDTSGITNFDSLMSPYMNGKVSASLDFTNTFGTIAASQQALANAVNSMARDIIGALNIGELIRVNVNNTVNDGNLFDHFVEIDRQEYNRTGRHAW